MAGIDSDRLYPMALQNELAATAARRAAAATVIASEFGHDGFLLEVDQVATVVAGALDA